MGNTIFKRFDQEGGVVIQVTELPDAALKALGTIVQYVGETTDSFTNGYFYKVVFVRQGSIFIHGWERTDVQPSTSGEIPASNVIFEDEEDAQTKVTELEQNVSGLQTTVAGHTTAIAALQSEIDSFIGAQTNFLLFFPDVASLPASPANPSWAMVGADIDALNAYVWNGTSWTMFGTKTYNFTDFSGVKTKVTSLISDVNLIGTAFVKEDEWTPNTSADNIAYEAVPGYGWIFALAENSHIYGIAVKLQAYSAGTTITRVKFTLKKDARDGEVLAYKYVNVSIGASAYQEVRCIFDEPIIYSGIIMLGISADHQYRFVKVNDITDYPFLPADGTEGHPRQGFISDSIDGPAAAASGTRIPYFQLYHPSVVLTDEQVNNIGTRVKEGISIYLPDKIYAVVGDTLQLFYRGMIRAKNPYNYDILVKCDRGKQTPRYYEYTPSVGDVGEYDFIVDVKDNNNKLLASKTTSLEVVSKAVSPSSVKHIVCVGSSVVQGGQWVAEAYRRLTGVGGTPSGDGLHNISFDGAMSKDGAGYFGAGGWSWRSFVTAASPAFRFQVTDVASVSLGATYSNNGHNYTVLEVNVTDGTGSILCTTGSTSYVPDTSGILTRVSGIGDSTISFSSASADIANPFWDDENHKVSFINYADTYCNGTIDVIYVQLNFNGLTDWMTDFSSIIADVKTFANALHTEFPSAKLKIMASYLPSVNGGMGANYGCNLLGDGFHDEFGVIASVLNLHNAYIDLARSDPYRAYVEVVNVAIQLDSENNMPASAKSVNTRNSATELVGTNGVHPATSGYMQIADAVYRNLTAELQ